MIVTQLMYNIQENFKIYRAMKMHIPKKRHHDSRPTPRRAPLPAIPLLQDGSRVWRPQNAVRTVTNGTMGPINQRWRPAGLLAIDTLPQLHSRAAVAGWRGAHWSRSLTNHPSFHPRRVMRISHERKIFRTMSPVLPMSVSAACT